MTPDLPSPNAAVTFRLLAAVGIASAAEARAVLKEHVTYALPRMTDVDIRQVIDAFDTPAGDDHYDRDTTDQPPRQRGVRTNLEEGEQL